MRNATLVVACLCLVLMFVPPTSAEEIEIHTQHERGYPCGANWNCQGSCCVGLVSYCYDSRFYQCFQPPVFQAVVCLIEESLCGLQCYDPNVYQCVLTIWGWWPVAKPPTRPTLAPTTKPPVTRSPTTVKATTPAPTTRPTTLAPTTPCPTTTRPTLRRTTAAPTTTPIQTTPAPTTIRATQAPTTPSPTTPSPTTPLPTTQATTPVPTTQATTPVPTTPAPTTPAPPPPSVTTTTTADNSNNGIIVSSTLDPGVTTYRIYRSNSSFTNVNNPNVTLLTTTNGSSYEDTSIVLGQQYCYAVVPTNGSNFNPNVTSSCNLVDAPITGLTCGNTGPVMSGQDITFYSSIATGTDVMYVWIVNDGGTAPKRGSGQNFTVEVDAVGTQTSTGETNAQVIAMNAKGTASCRTHFVVTN